MVSRGSSFNSKQRYNYAFGVLVWRRCYRQMGGLQQLQQLTTVFSGWVGLQKLITDLDRFYPYKGCV